MGEHEGVEGARRADSASLLFKGPTVVAALVCFVAAVFTAAAGVAIAFASGDLQGTLLVSLSSGDLPSQGLLDLVGAVMVGAGAGYGVSGVLLWSEVHWIKGVYAGLIVSMVGMVSSGLGTTLAPGMAAAGMIINVLIVTLLATETWEARRGIK